MTRWPTLRQEALGVLPAVLLGLVVTYYVGLIWAVSSRATSVDFVQFFMSARAVVEGRSPYAPLRRSDINLAPIEGQNSSDPLHPNLNPPLLAVVLAPVSTFGISASYVVWAALSLGCGLVACAWIVREQREAGLTAVGLVSYWLLFLVYYPTHTAVMLGQVTMALMLILVGVWCAARRGHDRAAGILLGLAFNLKLFVGLIVVFFLWQRRWRAAAWAAGSSLLLALATLPFVGYAPYLEYVRILPRVDWFSSNWNASYASVFTRVLGGSENVPLVNVPAVARWLVLLCSAGTLALLAWLTRPNGRGNRDTRFDLGFGLTLVVMLMVSPLGWMYYFPLLALPGLLVWSATQGERLRPARWALRVAWGLSAVPLAMVRAADANEPVRWLTLDSLYFYALLTLAGAGSGVLASLRPPSGIELGGKS